MFPSVTNHNLFFSFLIIRKKQRLCQLLFLTSLFFHIIIYLTFKLNVKYKTKEGDFLGLQHTLHALADPTRREILNLLKKGKLSAGDIVEHFSISGPAISRHLSVLKEADLIFDTRNGKFIYYELNTSVLEEILLWISELKGEKEDEN